MARVIAKVPAAAFTRAPSSLRFIPTGSTGLDCVLGGGWPLGRMSNIVGDSKTGKTLLAIEACANFAKVYPKGKIWYRESEAAFDKSYAAALGMPIDRIAFVESDCAFRTVEDFYNDLKAACETIKKLKVPGLYILDSLDALSDDAEMEREIDKGSYGANKAKKLHELFRKLVQPLNESGMSLIIVSQIKDKIGVVFGKTQERSGGHAMDFYASIIIWLHHLKRLTVARNKIERATGVRVHAKCDKNKVGLPFREFRFVLRFSYGIDDLQSNLEWLKEIGQLKAVPVKCEKEINKILDYADDLSDVDYVAFVDIVAQVTRELWARIEVDFLPTRKKY